MEIAQAYVTLTPKMPGIQKAIGEALGQALPTIDKSSDEHSKRYTSRFGSALKSGLAGLLAGVSIGALKQFTEGAVEQFAAVEDAAAAAGTVFGESFGIVSKQAENSAKSMGMSKAAALDASTTFGVFGKAAGLSGDDLAKFATEHTQLAADMASFRGTSPEEAIIAIGAAFRGETEPIRRYGVLLDDASLRQKAVELGIISTTKQALTPQQKTLAASALMWEQTKDAQGDFARTGDQVANTLKTQAAEAENAKAKIGEQLAPAWVAVKGAGTDALNAIANALPGLIDGLKDVGKWIQDNKVWLSALLHMALGAAAAFVIYKGALNAYTFATKVAEIATKLFNGTLKANPIGAVITLIGMLVGAIVWLYNNNETARRIIDAAWAGIKRAIAAVGDWITKTAMPAIKTAVKAVSDFFGEAGNRIRDSWNYMKDSVRAASDWVKVHVFEPLKSAVDSVKRGFELAKDGIGRAWDNLKEKAAAPIRFIIGTVYNDKIRGLWQRIKDAVWKDGPNLNYIPINFARGGVFGRNTDNDVLPGYTPGRDPFTFYDPVHGIRLGMSGGEGIIRPDALRALGGRAWLDRVNKSRGQNFAAGGIFGAAGDWLKEKASGVLSAINPVNAFKALFDNTIGRPVRALLSRIPGVGMVRDAMSKTPGILMDRLVSKGVEFLRNLGASLTGSGGSGSLKVAGGWMRPSAGPITSRFGAARGRYPHAGIDIAGGGATFAAAAGRVLKTGWNIITGRTGLGVLLDHGGGTFTYYGHNPVGGIKVGVGQQLARGARVGAQGATGNVTGTHLHFELHRGGIGRAVNPEVLGVFDRGGIVPPGMWTIENRTGRNEHLANVTPGSPMAGGNHYHFHGDVVDETPAQRLREELDKRDRQAAIKASLVGVI